MKISWNWLNEHIDLTGVSPDELGNRLTMTTAELEGIERLGREMAGVVTAKVVGVRKHPNADKLQLVKVDAGSEALEVVCGAPNVAVGQMAALARAGIVLPSGTEVKKAAIRGVESSGMLCSDRELGFSDDHSGILVLDPATQPGLPLSKALGIEDVVFEIDNKSLTHRPDLWSHYGIAREIAAITGRKLKPLDFEAAVGAGDTLKVSVLDPKLCPRYIAVQLDGIRIGDSPRWLQRRLEAVGVRPISNIVDITNYVMLEIGNPIHAFDARLLEGREIRVRTAQPGEKIVTIDGVERELTPAMLVIADARKPVALAGVMGGQESEIQADTTSMVLESANFNAASVRRTSIKLGLRTEASTRFEKSLDPEYAYQAAKLFVKMTQQLCPGSRAVSRLYDVSSVVPRKVQVRVTGDFVRRRLGVQLPTERVRQLLESLEFGVAQQGDEMTVTVPSFRATKDISIPEDLVEEVGRLYGYDNIEPKLPRVFIKPPLKLPEKELEREVRGLLSLAAGFTEVSTYAFNSQPVLAKLGVDSSGQLQLANPVAQDTDRLRVSLVPNLLALLDPNLRHFDSLRMYELGRVFWPREGGALPQQDKMVCGLIADKKLKGDRDGKLFYAAKGVVQALLAKLGVASPVFSPVSSVIQPWVNPSRAATVRVAGSDPSSASILECSLQAARSSGFEQAEACTPAERSATSGFDLGIVTELHPKALDALAVKAGVALFDLNLTRLLKAPKREFRYQPLPKFPGVIFDISLLLDRKVKAQDVEALIRQADPKLIAHVELFSVFQGAPIPEGKKSLSFTVTVRSETETLKDEVAKDVHERILKSVAKVGATLRGSL
ncbi:MAG: phenylalanine--tRNA ligase subunit beta [Planctomycetes bacterium]|nr:phenylalanine--tRNA ligase subunit beta [Planctomycetota bacterium]